MMEANRHGRSGCNVVFADGSRARWCGNLDLRPSVGILSSHSGTDRLSGLDITNLMYKILGADQMEYGPVGADEIRQWIAQGRANAQTLVQAEGGAEWRPLNTFPEFAGALATVPAATVFYPALPMGGASGARTNGLAIAGFILGLLSLICCFVGPLFSSAWPHFLLHRTLRKSAKNRGQSGKGLAIAGIILAVCGILLFGFLMLAGMLGSVMQDMQVSS